MTKLSFYDQARQSYADVIKIDTAGEFHVGDYGDDGSHDVGDAGEFTVALHRFQGQDYLCPQLRVFGDATGALREFIELGGLSVLDDVSSCGEFSQRLSAMGLRDASDSELAIT